jgi:RalA-binding protein 1
LAVDPGNGHGWTVEKQLPAFLVFDQEIRDGLKTVGGRDIPSVPENKVWKDRAPTACDGRRVRKFFVLLHTILQLSHISQAALDVYRKAVVSSDLPAHLKQLLVEFLTRDVPPSDKNGGKAGYLSKRGSKLGGWKLRYFNLDGPVLKYFDTVRILTG